MEAPVRIVELQNGLIFRFIDRTRHYYGGFYHVKVEVCCELSVAPELFTSSEQHFQAVAILGRTVNYSKVLERMGVPESDIPTVRDEMITKFVTSSHAYISAPSFPSGVVRTELEKRVKKRPGRSVYFRP
jgi:hypothetical protein